MGVKPTRVVRAVRECVEILKAGATGKPVRYQGEIFKVGWYNPAWVRSPPPMIYAGANGPQMLKAAPRYADGVMVSDFVVEHVAPCAGDHRRRRCTRPAANRSHSR